MQDKINQLCNEVTSRVVRRMKEIAVHEEAVRLWRDEFWPGVALAKVRERLTHGVRVDLKMDRSPSAFLMASIAGMEHGVNWLPVKPLTDDLFEETLKWLRWRKIDRDNKLVGEAVKTHRTIIGNQSVWKRYPKAVREAAIQKYALKIAEDASR